MDISDPTVEQQPISKHDQKRKSQPKRKHKKRPQHKIEEQFQQQ
jgi:hypothetical protein